MAEVLKKQRKFHGGHRAHVKKLFAQVEDSITNFEPSLQDKLLQQKIILREKLNTLKSLDEKILELIDDENEEESIEHEVTEASEITDKITWALVRIDSTLKSLQSPIWTSFERRNSRQITKIGDEKVQWSTDGMASVHRLF